MIGFLACPVRLGGFAIVLFTGASSLLVAQEAPLGDDGRATQQKLEILDSEIEKYETLVANRGAPREWFFHLGELRELRRKLAAGEIDPEDPLVVGTPEGETAVLSEETGYTPAHLVGLGCREIEDTPLTRAKAELDRIAARLTAASSLASFVQSQLLEADRDGPERANLKREHDALVKKVDRLTVEWEAASKKLSVVEEELDRLQQACSDPVEDGEDATEAWLVDGSYESDPLGGRICTPGETRGEEVRIGPEAMVVSTEGGAQGRDVHEIEAEIDRSIEALEGVEEEIESLQRRYDRAVDSLTSLLDEARSLERIGEEMSWVEKEIVESIARARGPISPERMEYVFGAEMVIVDQERVDLQEELARLRAKSPASADALERLMERRHELALEHGDVLAKRRQIMESVEFRSEAGRQNRMLDWIDEARDRRDALRKKLADLETERARTSPSPRAETSGLEPACVPDDELPGGVLP